VNQLLLISFDDSGVEGSGEIGRVIIGSCTGLEGRDVIISKFPNASVLFPITQPDAPEPEAKTRRRVLDAADI